MDKRKVYAICFKKVYMTGYKPDYAYYVSDADIMATLKGISDDNSFKLLSVFLSNSYECMIKIKCYSYDVEKILYDFSAKLGEKIEHLICRRRLF